MTRRVKDVLLGLLLVAAVVFLVLAWWLPQPWLLLAVIGALGLARGLIDDEPNDRDSKEVVEL